MKKTMPEMPWQTYNTRLFKMGSEVPQPIFCATIDDVDFKAGLVKLRGIFPSSQSLFEIENGVMLDVVNERCIGPDFYCEEDVVMRFRNCRITRKLSGPIMDTSDHVAEFHVWLDCDIEVVFDEATKGEGQ